MSWAVHTVVARDGNDVSDVMEKLREEAVQQNPDCGPQFDAVAEAAMLVVHSGAVGERGKQFTLTLSGHANPNHEPREGWANDSVTIAIYQKTD